MRGRMDCTVITLNIEILMFSCILNKLINKFYCLFFFLHNFHTSTHRAVPKALAQKLTTVPVDDFFTNLDS